MSMYRQRLKLFITKLINRFWYLIFFINKPYERTKIFFQSKNFNYDYLIKKINSEHVLNLAIVVITPNTLAKFSIRYLLKGLINNGYTIVLPCAEKDNNKDWILKEFPTINIVNRPDKGRDFAVWKYVLISLLKDIRLCKNIKSLILINDSMYFNQKTENIIHALKNANKHWSCLFESFQKHYHAQSFALQFSNKLINSPLFLSFWEAYVPYDNKMYTIYNGEINLSKTLIKTFGLPEVVFKGSTLIKKILNFPENEIHTLINVLKINFHYMNLLKFHYGNGEEKLYFFSPFLEENPQIARVKEILMFILSIAFEKMNPSHSMGLILNIMFGAPFKKDLALIKYYRISEIVSNVNYHTDSDLIEMEEDLKLKEIAKHNSDKFWLNLNILS